MYDCVAAVDMTHEMFRTPDLEELGVDGHPGIGAAFRSMAEQTGAGNHESAVVTPHRSCKELLNALDLLPTEARQAAEGAG